MGNSEIVHYNLVIRGKVQGVGFRYNAKKVADNLKVSGWIRNADDGSVVIEAEGNPENLEMFLKWCEAGPAPALVDQLEKNEGPIRDFEGFEVIF